MHLDWPRECASGLNGPDSGQGSGTRRVPSPFRRHHGSCHALLDAATASRFPVRHVFVGWAIGCLVLSLPGTAADAVAVRADAAQALGSRSSPVRGNARRAVGPGTRREGAAIRCFRPTSRGRTRSTTSIPTSCSTPERRLFRLWYKCVLADKEVIAKMMPPATVHDVGWFLLYATSQDGVRVGEAGLGPDRLRRLDGKQHRGPRHAQRGRVQRSARRRRRDGGTR